MKWRYFFAAVILASTLLLSVGAPPISVVLGIGLALAYNLVKQRSSKTAL
jgi:hypothetical protein